MIFSYRRARLAIDILFVVSVALLSQTRQLAAQYRQLACASGGAGSRQGRDDTC